jgi:uridine phosphorylase
MSLPRLPSKLISADKVTASILHERLKKMGRAPKYVVPENIIMYFSLSDAPKWTVPFERKHFLGARLDLMNLSWGILSGVGMGAPAMAFYLELLQTLGAKRIVALGQAGSLSETHKVGEVLLVEKALRDEGTSFHYLPPGEFSFPTENLNQRLLDPLTKNKEIKLKNAVVWSTDAIFRETDAEVKAFAEKGIAAVDMETSALFAVAHHRKVEAASLLVISDELWPTTWNPQFASVTGIMQKLAESIIALRWQL